MLYGVHYAYVYVYVEFVLCRWDFVLTPNCGFTLILCPGGTAVSTMRFVSHIQYIFVINEYLRASSLLI